MAEDNDISRRYRELAREEPPRHVDEAIRAAARRAVGTRPAPLVVPTGRQRWYFPLAAAAVIMLAVAVTLHVEREQPGEELVTAPAEKPKAEEPRSAPQPERRRRAESADSRELRDAAPPPELQKAPGTGTATPPPPASPAREPRPAQDATAIQENGAGARLERAEPPPVLAPEPPVAASAARPAPSIEARSAQIKPQAGALSAYAVRSPEQWLQGIADLRRQGRHDEADKSLAEFRKRYPDYRISKEVLEQVEKR